MASSVPSETFPTRVRFRGWMSEADGFLCPRLPASLTWPARPGPRPSPLSRPWMSSRRSRRNCRPRSHPPPALQSQRHLRSLASATAPPVPAVPAASQVARVRGRSAVLPPVPQSRRRLRSLASGWSAVLPPVPQSRRRLRSLASATGPPCYRVRGRSAVRFAPSIWIRGVRLGFPDWRGSAGPAQRINGVSRLLPYSDLLALTSSSRRGEDVSDRGSWKRLRILLTGHVDAHAEPDIETVAVPYRACVVP
jgi:hypothetical protein